jgi:predicted nucleic acid-binding protein
MGSLTALLDASVLYSAFLRDLLLSVATTVLYRPRWSNMIHEEWMRNLLTNRPDLNRRQLERIRSLMEAAIPDGLVAGFEPLIQTLSLPDPDDRHVLAAAIHASADVIVTDNLRDFPQAELANYQIEAQLPDEFVEYLFDLDADLVIGAIAQHRARLKRPARSPEQYIDALLQQQMSKTATLMRRYAGRF